MEPWFDDPLLELGATPALYETARALAQLGGRARIADVATLLDIKANTARERLVRLAKLGAAQRLGFSLYKLVDVLPTKTTTPNNSDSATAADAPER